MSPSLTFIKQTNLDSEVIESYRVMRSLLKDNNFTEEEIKTITYMPDELMKANMNMRSKVKKLYGDLYKYGLSDYPETLPDDVSEYIESRFKEVNQEYPLDENTGFYGEEGPFGRPDKMF